MFSLLGPNGAGKTTTLEILEGFREPSAGKVEVLGFDPRTGGRAFRERVGIVLQGPAVEPYLTVRELVKRNAGYYPNPRSVDEVIALVGLEDKAKARAKTLSGGQQRRLDVALGIVGRPELLFLDEPTTGFDPGARRGAWELVQRLAAEGATILLTTHYMDEAQHLADRVAVISQGAIVAEGSPDTIGGRATAAVRIRFTLPPGFPTPSCRSRTRSSRATSSSTRTTRCGSCTRSPAGPWIGSSHSTGSRWTARASRTSTWGSSGERPCRESRRAVPLPAAVRAEELLAQPGGRGLHVRLPDPVPGHLRLAQPRRHDRLPRGQLQPVPRPGDPRVRGGQRDLHEPGHDHHVPARQRDPQAPSGHAPAGGLRARRAAAERCRGDRDLDHAARQLRRALLRRDLPGALAGPGGRAHRRRGLVLPRSVWRCRASSRTPTRPPPS